MKRTMNARRYSRALTDLGERMASSANGHLSLGDIEIIATRHSDSLVEKATMSAWLQEQVR